MSHLNNNTKNTAFILFPDGTKLNGLGFGKKGIAIAETCFNTSITGYQEIISDPSYSGQIIVFTFPHIGNVGVNKYDIESINPRVKGIIIREKITNPSNYRSEKKLEHWLEKHDVTGIYQIDTRKLTKFIKKNGASNIAIIYENDLDDVNIDKILPKLQDSLLGKELASESSSKKIYNFDNTGIWQNDKYNKIDNYKYNLVVIDYGCKLNILRCITELKCNVTVVPAKTNYKEIIKHNPDGVLLSNGPGDPAETIKYTKNTIKSLLDANIPIFGICLGHQLLALTLDAKTIKMQQGHRGANHPIKNLLTNKVEITSQNHGFAVDKNNLPENIEITHVSLFDQTIAGIRVKNKNAFSVQYHPESSPGPNDSFYIFEEFIELIKNGKK